MADLLHHHRFRAGSDIDLPTRVYWAAGIGLTLLAAGLMYAMLTTTAGFDASVSLPVLAP